MENEAQETWPPDPLEDRLDDSVMMLFFHDILTEAEMERCKDKIADYIEWRRDKG